MSASCDKLAHENLPPLRHLVEHLHWGCTDQAQQVWLLDAYRAEVLREVAMAVRAASPKYLDDDVDRHVFHVLDALANKIAAGDLS